MTQPDHAAVNTLSLRLAQARRARTLIERLPPELSPRDATAAFAIQHEIVALGGTHIGGWKVGAKSPDGPIQGAPLPLDGIHPSGAVLERRAAMPLGLELEIAFRFKRVFEPRSAPYTADEVRQAIGTMGITIELVASRYASWPEVEPLAQLADLQNHGALVLGDFVPYREDFPFLAPPLRMSFAGRDVTPAAVFNPAGDPRRLLPWLVNHCARQGVALTPDMTISAGSYTGLLGTPAGGTLHGHIEGLGAVSLTLS
jgi:2-keto-4-pentenoate hydratase